MFVCFNFYVVCGSLSEIVHIVSDFLLHRNVGENHSSSLHCLLVNFLSLTNFGEGPGVAGSVLGPWNSRVWAWVGRVGS